MKRTPLLLALLFFINFSFSQELEIKSIKNQIKEKQIELDSLNKLKEKYTLKYLHSELKEYGLPQLENGEELIEHKAYILVYSEKHEQAKWVAHIISKEIIDGNVSRTNDFRPDTMIKTGSAVEKDYFLKYKEDGKTVYDGFGYDRGHLAPSADFKWSKSALSESYFYSNMSPQVDDFNRGGWAKLEGMLRKYVYENNVDLFVVTGPVLSEDLPVIERSVDKVSIPNYYYKIAYDKENNRAIAFLMPNQNLDYPVEYYAVSIDSVEALTNIDFFYNLDDSLQLD